MNRQQALAAGAKRYFGKVCAKHPELKGERRINRCCPKCTQAWHDRNIELCRSRRRLYYELSRERQLGQMRVWREANREQEKARKRAVYEANRERMNARTGMWQKANRERYLARQRTWREANREYVRAANRIWHKANRDYSNAQRSARRIRKKLEDQACT